jgi:hypothetical protein
VCYKRGAHSANSRVVHGAARIQFSFELSDFRHVHKIKTMSHNPQNRKAVRDSEDFWQLDGESELTVETDPHPPQATTPTVIRLTHSNTYGPFDAAEFFVRRGELHQATKPDDLDSARDWVKAELVEELVFVDDEEILRSEAEEPFEEETPWEGTYEASLQLPAGRQRLEIKIVSGEPELLRSIVLADWEVNVQP